MQSSEIKIKKLKSDPPIFFLPQNLATFSDFSLFALQLRTIVLYIFFFIEFLGQNTYSVTSMPFYFDLVNLDAQVGDYLRVKTNTFFDAHTLNYGLSLNVFDFKSILVGE